LPANSGAAPHVLRRFYWKIDRASVGLHVSAGRADRDLALRQTEGDFVRGLLRGQA
jgi:hypothetical protein